MVHRVYWADDSPSDHVLIRVAVAELGLPVKVASFDWGTTLLEALEGQRPNLVVLDIAMPGMNGVETLRRIRASGNDVPVVVFSTACIEEEVEECQKLGIEGFYVKPAQFTDYLQTVRRILGRAMAPSGPGRPAAG